MSYMGRCTHMLEGGTHMADVALFYNAEGEWTGGENQTFHALSRVLTNELIDFDIIPYDYLKDAEVIDKHLSINGERFGALIVSRSEILPSRLLSCFARLAKAGLPIIFTDSLPTRVAEGDDINAYNPYFQSVPTESLGAMLREKGLCHISGVGEYLKYLRFYHVKREKEDIYLFSNEAIRNTVNATVTLPQSGECVIYEPWHNRCYRGVAKDGKLPIRLENGNMLFVIFGGDMPKDLPDFCVEVARKPLPLCFDIATKDEGESDFSTVATNAVPFDISKENSRFSGEVLYQAKFTADPAYTVLDLGEVGEVCEAWLNGQYLGSRINAPYKFSLKDALREGENDLKVLVKSNLGHRRRDQFSKYLQLPPTGIIGEIALCQYKTLEI